MGRLSRGPLTRWRTSCAGCWIPLSPRRLCAIVRSKPREPGPGPRLDFPVPLALDSAIGPSNAEHRRPSTAGQREAPVITKFDSLFAGHIDMDNVGYAGIAVNDRRFPNEALATVFDKA